MVREGSGESRGRPGDSTKDPGGVKRPTRKFGRGQKDHSEVREGRETHPVVREGSVSQRGGAGGVKSPTCRSGRGR